MEITLYDWAPSPFCIKVRAILDYKRVPYRISPALKSVFELRRRGGVGKAPALDIDGRFVVDSTDIAYELERLFPDPAIIPADAHRRAQCHVLEDWSDEALYFIGLYFQWIDPRGAAMVPKAFGKSLTGRLAYQWYRRLISNQVRGHGTGRKTPQHVESDLVREVEAIDGLLSQSPYLLGDAPMLCDFALLGQLTYLERPPRTAEALRAYPRIGDYVVRLRALCKQARPTSSHPQPSPVIGAAAS